MNLKGVAMHDDNDANVDYYDIVDCVLTTLLILICVVGIGSIVFMSF